MKSTPSTPQKKVKLLSGLDWKPTAYMRRAMRWVLEHPNCGLFLDPGLRKTSITLGAFRLLKAKGMVRRMLVVAPVRVAYNVWPSEIEKWKQFQDLNVVVLHGADKCDELLDREDVDIYVINPEGLEWLLGRPGKKKGEVLPNNERFKRLDCQMFVLDESSKFKNTQTKRFKILRPFLPKFLRRVILTGSPAPKNYLDLFGQVYIMDLGKSFGPYITHYRNKYFDPTGFGGFSWKLREGSDKLIQKAVKPYVMRLEAEDYIDMPKLEEPNVWCDLPPDARKMYDEMEDELVYILEGGDAMLSAPTASAARGKCAQIAGGAVYKNKEGLEIRGKMDFIEVHDTKLQALEELLDERQGQPTIVFYWYQHELVRIRKYLGKRFGDLPSISEVSLKKGKEIENAWNRNEISVLLAQPASVGHGLNMQEGNAQHVVWYTLPDDFDIYDQAIRRIRRSGNTASHVWSHRLMARDTVDVVKMKLLAKKGANQKDFLDAMKSYRKPRSKK
jgi:SNF2 family DNA or RNA helicase